MELLSLDTDCLEQLVRAYHDKMALLPWPANWWKGYDALSKTDLSIEFQSFTKVIDCFNEMQLITLPAKFSKEHEQIADKLAFAYNLEQHRHRSYCLHPDDIYGDLADIIHTGFDFVLYKIKELVTVQTAELQPVLP